MSFDLFGHGIRKLPSLNTELYSDGQTENTDLQNAEELLGHVVIHL